MYLSGLVHCRFRPSFDARKKSDAGEDNNFDFQSARNAGSRASLEDTNAAADKAANNQSDETPADGGETNCVLEEEEQNGLVEPDETVRVRAID
jgi:hypothetical protein